MKKSAIIIFINLTIVLLYIWGMLEFMYNVLGIHLMISFYTVVGSALVAMVGASLFNTLLKDNKK